MKEKPATTRILFPSIQQFCNAMRKELREREDLRAEWEKVKAAFWASLSQANSPAISALLSGFCP